ncbi:MAG: hypothetical protein ACR2PL_16970 [Dehalococcoidia bacterium]
MNDYTRDELVEDVLDAYMTAASDPDWNTLVTWIERYPQFERELTEFAVAWSRVEALPEPPELSPAQTERFVQRGMVAVQRLLTQASPLISSLLDAGKAQGLSSKQLAERTGLSIVLVGQLNQRLIRYASIPGELIERLARTVHQESAAVRRYLQGGPILAGGALYKANQAPTVAPPQDFVAAVRADPMLSDEQRRRLLALAEPGGDGARQV